MASALSVDFVFHPAAPTPPTPTLSFGALVNVIGDEAALPLRARHVFVIVALLGVLGRRAGVLCLHVQFGNVAKGVRSLYGVGRDGAPHLWFGSAGIGLRFSPGGDGKALTLRINPRDQEMLLNEPLFLPLSAMFVAEEACSCNQEQQQSRNSSVKDVGRIRERF